jgi:glycerophosphoryl diester phosphodiesterase
MNDEQLKVGIEIPVRIFQWAVAACVMAACSAYSVFAVEIIAHRGASHQFPENTLSAFNAGYAQGADACELDIHLTRDHKIVVMHDSDTLRTGGVKHRLAQEKWSVLKRVNVSEWGKWKGRGYTDTVPLLKDVLRWIPEGKRLFIEIKPGPELLPELKTVLSASRRKPEQLALIGFDFETMRAAKKDFPEIPVYWLAAPNRKNPGTPTAQELVDKVRGAGLDGLDLAQQFPIDPTFVETVHRAGLKLFTWTVDDPNVARAQAKAGVDGITTNRPQWLREQLSGFGK